MITKQALLNMAAVDGDVARALLKEAAHDPELAEMVKEAKQIRIIGRRAMGGVTRRTSGRQPAAPVMPSQSGPTGFGQGFRGWVDSVVEGKTAPKYRGARGGFFKNTLLGDQARRGLSWIRGGQRLGDQQLINQGYNNLVKGGLKTGLVWGGGLYGANKMFGGGSPGPGAGGYYR